MGMYTEFYFRANVKDGEAADWLHSRINSLGCGGLPFDAEHPFFQNDRWESVIWGAGAVYQEARRPIFRRKDSIISQYYNQLVIASSMKGGGSIDTFIDWITPHLDETPGSFLGFSLYEDSRPCGWGDNDKGLYVEQPHLYYMGAIPGDQVTLLASGSGNPVRSV